MIKSKKADITVTVLVIGVVAICFLTLISFYNSSSDIDFHGIGLIETMKSIDEELKLQGFERPYDNTNIFDGNGVLVFLENEEVVGSYVVDEEVKVKIFWRR